MKRKLVLTAAAMLTLGCSRDAWQRAPGPDDAVALIPWFANMYTDIAIRPYKQPMMPPDGVVPVTGADPVIDPREMAPVNSDALGRRFPNPIPRTAASIERGRDRYNIYCALCHGDQGLADSELQTLMPFILPVVSDRATAYSDGYLYAMIVAGRGLMRPYNDKVRGDDRWHIVNYLRVLQGTN